MKNILVNAWKTGFRHWKIVLLVYSLQLVLAIPLAMQVWHVLEASIGKSLEIDKLLPGYDHTVISDFLKVHGASITPLIGQLRWVLLVWALVSVFVNGGILATIVKKTPNWLSFWTGGAAYFFRFFKVALVFTVLLALWSGLTLLPFLANLQHSLETMATEKSVLGLLAVVLLAWLAGLVFFSNAGIAAKTAVIAEGLTTWKAVKKGLGFAGRRYGKAAAVFLFFNALQLLALLAYWWAEGRSGMVSPALVLVFFGLQQLLVLFRLTGRLMAVAGVSSLYESLAGSKT